MTEFNNEISSLFHCALTKPQPKLHDKFQIFEVVSEKHYKNIRGKSGRMLLSPPFFASLRRLKKSWGPRTFCLSSLFLLCSKQEKWSLSPLFLSPLFLSYMFLLFQAGHWCLIFQPSNFFTSSHKCSNTFHS
jgi:hypothetical protein